MGRLNDEHDVALVVFRKKGTRDTLINQVGATEQRHKKHKSGIPQVQHPSHARSVKRGALRDHFVEQLKKAAFRTFAVMP